MQIQSNQSQSFQPLFPLGDVVATPGALARLASEEIPTIALIRRHVSGDWGECCEEDIQTNNEALKCGMRILSVYFITGDASESDKRIWIITEADRSVTTLLLPEEY